MKALKVALLVTAAWSLAWGYLVYRVLTWTP